MTLIDKAEALAPCPFCGAAFKMGQEPHDSPYVGGFFYLYHDYGPLGSKARKCPISVNGHYETAELALAAWNRRAALPARGVGVPEIDGWVRRLRKTEEAGHVHHLSKADRLAIADFLAALATAQEQEARP